MHSHADQKVPVLPTSMHFNTNTLVLVSAWGSCSSASSDSKDHTYFCVEAVIRQAAGGEEQDGCEGRDVLQEAEEGGPECTAHCIPPALHVWYVEDAGRRSLSLTEQLDENKNTNQNHWGTFLMVQ